MGTDNEKRIIFWTFYSTTFPPTPSFLKQLHLWDILFFLFPYVFDLPFVKSFARSWSSIYLFKYLYSPGGASDLFLFSLPVDLIYSHDLLHATCIMMTHKSLRMYFSSEPDSAVYQVPPDVPQITEIPKYVSLNSFLNSSLL